MDRDIRLLYRAAMARRASDIQAFAAAADLVLLALAIDRVAARRRVAFAIATDCIDHPSLEHFAMATNSFPMGTSPRKQLAGTEVKGPSDDFGVSPVLGGVPSINHMDNPVHGRGVSHAPMPEQHRGPPIPGGAKKMRNQRHPDHGPHHNH